jgi:hypothetical protein
VTRFPDPVRSRAVLIGVSHFPESPELADLPAVRQNVAGLWRRLTDPETGVFDTDHCVVADPAASVAELGRAIGGAAAEASDLLLIYYAGHGLVDDRGRLYLAVNQTLASAPKYSGLGVDLLREDVGNSAAAARVLVLDCCFSGRAIEVMGDEEGLISGQLAVAGTYTMTSTTANAPAYSLSGHRYTAFSGALLAALDNPEPLSLDEIYRKVAEDLHARGLPRPQQRATNTAGALALSRGRSEADPPGEPPPDEVRFGVDSATQRARLRAAVVPGFLVTAVLATAMGALFAVLNHDPSWLWGVPFMVGLMALIFGLIAGGLSLVSAKEPELLVDRSGITTTWRQTGSPGRLRAHVAWKDVSHVGVLRPRPGTVNPKMKQVYEANHALVVRLRPEVPDPPARDAILPKELRQLGYHAIGRIGSFGARKKELLSALERFAGDRVLHTEREFLARDPRLGPDAI